jgi:hypothetical protein
MANSPVLAARSSCVGRATLSLLDLAASACPGFTPRPSIAPDDASDVSDAAADAPSDAAEAMAGFGDPGHGGAGGPPGSAREPWSGLSGAAGLDEYEVYGATLASIKTALQIF